MNLTPEENRILRMSHEELETELAKDGETFDGSVKRVEAVIEKAKAEAEMRRAISAWMRCPQEKRPSAKALGQRIIDLAAAIERRDSL